MIIINQIEHLKSLNGNLQYKEVIQFANITLHIALEQKRYAEALKCYELLANASHGIGDISSFSGIMVEYEKLCLIHGEPENKMTYFYLLSILNSMVNNTETIIACKKSIQYASSLNHVELFAANYAMIAAQLSFFGQLEQAKIAAQLALYYKTKNSNTGPLKVKVNMGLLYYYAGVNNYQQFQLIKNELLQLLGEMPLIYHAQLAFSEGTILAKQQKFHLSGIELTKAYVIFKEQGNTIGLHLIFKIINRFQLKNYVEFYDESFRSVNDVGMESIIYKQIQCIPSDIALDNVRTTFTYKYPNLHTEKSMETYVNELLQAEKNVYCFHWSFITNEIEELFGGQFAEQLLFKLFDAIYKSTSAYGVEFLIFTRNEGEFIVKDISIEDFFALIMELEQQLQSIVVQLTLGAVEIPIHFGFVDSKYCLEDEVTYETLVTHADARLYYAKSHGQLYMYS